MMDTSIAYKPIEPTDEERVALDGWDYGQIAVDMQHVLDTGDAPPLVLAYFRRRLEHRKAWDEGAKNRPFSHHPDSPAVRLFDGPWISHIHNRNAVPEALEANFPVDGEEHVLERRVALIWPTYQKLMDAEDEEGCRKMAAAIYKFIEMKTTADRMLVVVAHTLDSQLREARAKKQAEELTKLMDEKSGD